MNVFIFPTDDRSGLASMIYHYSKLGHKVFIPRKGTLSLRWERIATWPAMLCKSSEDKTKRNLELYPFEENISFFGEDYFLKDFFSSSLYDDDISCSIVNLEEKSYDIDVFHTLRGADEFLPSYFAIAKIFFPKAKWVSSTLSAWNSNPGNYNPLNVAKFIPANYENKHSDVNNINILCVPFEKELLDINCKSNEIPENISFASFNHNFHVRQVADHSFFTRMNDLLKKKDLPEVPNFGGNVRSSGADIRYSGSNGVVGKFQTLSPRQCYKFISSLKAAIHFKQTDWGGGVFYYCLNSGIPIVTTKSYVQASNSSSYLIDGYNSIIIDNDVEASNVIEKLTFDDRLVENLKSGMSEIQNQIFSEIYWNNWEKFLKGLT